MRRYVALLRGIAPALPNNSNVQLRGVLEGLVHDRGTYLVVTFLKDGNDPPDEVPDDPDPRVRVVGFDEEASAFLTIIDHGDPGTTPDFMRWLDRTYGKDITTRTWLTVQRTVARLAQP